MTELAKGEVQMPRSPGRRKGIMLFVPRSQRVGFVIPLPLGVSIIPHCLGSHHHGSFRNIRIV